MAELRPLLIGVGNRSRGDDAAGPLVAEAFRALASGGVDVAECGGESTRLVALMEGRDLVVIVDACRSGGAAGAIHRFDVSNAPLPAALRNDSSHGLGVAEGVELARVLGLLPVSVIVYAIEAESFAAGAAPSAVVNGAVVRAAGLAAAELAARACSDSRAI